MKSECVVALSRVRGERDVKVGFHDELPGRGDLDYSDVSLDEAYSSKEWCNPLVVIWGVVTSRFFWFLVGLQLGVSFLGAWFS